MVAVSAGANGCAKTQHVLRNFNGKALMIGYSYILYEWDMNISSSSVYVYKYLYTNMYSDALAYSCSTRLVNHA